MSGYEDVLPEFPLCPACSGKSPLEDFYWRAENVSHRMCCYLNPVVYTIKHNVPRLHIGDSRTPSKSIVKKIMYISCSCCGKRYTENDIVYHECLSLLCSLLGIKNVLDG